jgi:plastocyanin
MRAFILIPLILPCAGSAAGQPVAAPVQGIALYSYGYNPDPIVLTAGKAVTFNFVNRATKGHDFTAKKFFQSSRIISGNVGEGEVDLAPGQSASVTLVPAAGRYKVHCGHPFHKMLGMSGDIVVR